MVNLPSVFVLPFGLSREFLKEWRSLEFQLADVNSATVLAVGKSISCDIPTNRTGICALKSAADRVSVFTGHEYAVDLLWPKNTLVVALGMDLADPGA